MPTYATEVEGCLFDLGAARGSNFQAYLSMANIFCVNLALSLWGSSYVCLPSINVSSLCENVLVPEIKTPFPLPIFMPALHTPQ